MGASNSEASMKSRAAGLAPVASAASGAEHRGRISAPMRASRVMASVASGARMSLWPRVLFLPARAPTSALAARRELGRAFRAGGRARGGAQRFRSRPSRVSSPAEIAIDRPTFVHRLFGENDGCEALLLGKRLPRSTARTTSPFASRNVQVPTAWPAIEASASSRMRRIGVGASTRPT